MASGSGSGSGSGPGPGRYLEPQHVFDLVIGRRSQELLDYLYSVPGACADVRCLLASFAARALQAPRPGISPPWPSEDSWAMYWANYARTHAILSRLYVPPLGYPSDPVRRHAAFIDQLDASSLSTPTAMLPPQQKSYNAVLNFPTTLARTHASDFAPWGTNSTLELSFTKLSLGQPGSEKMTPQELMQNNSVMGLLSPCQPQSVQLTPHRLMQNREVDIKGKGPAPEVHEQKLLVHVATFMADGTTGAAGLLIKKGTGQFLCASYFPMSVRQPVLLAAACCEGIKIARAYQPSTILVESHQFHLFRPYLAGADAPCLHMEELLKLLDPPRCTVERITKERNSTACQLALRCLADGLARIFFGSLPAFFVLT